MVRPSHWSSEGCGFNLRLGLRNRFSEDRAWRLFIYYLLFSHYSPFSFLSSFCSPAHYAAIRGLTSALEILHKYKGSLELENSVGDRPLHNAAFHGQLGKRVVVPPLAQHYESAACVLWGKLFPKELFFLNFQKTFEIRFTIFALSERGMELWTSLNFVYNSAMWCRVF